MVQLKEKVKQLKNDIPAIFLAMKKPDTPWYAKLLAVITVFYALSPVDLIPDFIPILGYVDDILILPGLVAITVKLVPAEVMSDCRRESAGMWENGKPKKWYYALPIILIWMLLLWIIIKTIWLSG